MSFCCCITNKNGFVIASDSRSVVMGADGIKSFSDNFQKVIYLPNAKLGIVSSGQNLFNGETISTVLTGLEPSLIGLNCEDALRTIERTLRACGLVSPINVCIAKATAQSEPESYFMDVKPEDGSAVIHGNSGIWRNTPMSVDIFADLYLKKQSDDKVGILIPLNTMSLNEMAAFAKHLIETYIAVHHFRIDLLPIVGGPIQMICVDRQGNVCDDH